VLVACTQQNFSISRLRVECSTATGETSDDEPGAGHGKRAGYNEVEFSEESSAEKRADNGSARRIVTVALEVQGARSIAKLVAKLAEIAGVVSVNAGDENVPSD
jgi:hypothetical protein